MAILLNSYSTTGIMSLIRNTSNVFEPGTQLKIWPSTVTFPTSPIETTGSTPGGHILTYTGLTFTLTGNTITITAGTTSANATAAGTLSWWGLQSTTSGNGTLISDSIGLSGAGKIMTVNTMTPANAQSVTVTFNFTIV